MTAPTNDTGSSLGNLGPESSIYFVNLFLCISLNIIVLTVIYRQREIQNVMRLLHRILAIASLAEGVISNVWSILWFAYQDQYSCSLISLVFMFPSRFTVVMIMACHCSINLNLYLLISRPMHYHIIVTPIRVRVAIVLPPFSSLSCSVDVRFL